MDLDGLEGQLYMFTVLNPLLALDLLFLECGNPWHHELRCVAGFNSRTLSSLLPATVERVERGANCAPAGEVAVPLPLRRPLGPRTCVGTASLCSAV